MHGGIRGFDKALWQGRELRTGDSEALELQYVSRDGVEGFPGGLRVQVIYSLTNDNELKIDYAASTDADTVINLTNHSYFNLSDDADETILGHELLLNAEGYLPVNASLIPNGAIESVSGTSFDFSKSATIGSRINADHLQLNYGKGYDHNWMQKKPRGE